MPRAVLRNGLIVPIDPLPPDWPEGKELWVDEAGEPALDLDCWQREMEALCADSEPAEEERLQTALNQIREQAKTRMRQQAGLR